MPDSRRRKRLGNVALAALAVVTLGGVGFVLTEANASAQRVGPVSPQVQKYYDENVAGAKATLPTHAAAPTVVFIGDSYTAGAGASAGSKRWTTLLSAHMGWVENNLGRGGTGYLATSGKQGCGLDYCPSYDEMIAEAAKANPSIVVVSGGRNDSQANPADRLAAVNAFYADLHAALPKAKIVSLSPLWDATEAPAELSDIGASAEAACTANACSYVDIGQPLAAHPDLIAADKVHPNDAGHNALYLAVENALAKVPAQ